jgi:hypothetical protein
MPKRARGNVSMLAPVFATRPEGAIRTMSRPDVIVRVDFIAVTL